MRRVLEETPYWLESSAVPCLTVALLENGKTQDVLCFGTTKPNGSAPITEKAIFKAASLSKQALLYAALKTIEANKLEIDRPVGEYVDKPYPANDDDIERITARHVLTHTTGWPNWPPEGESITRAHPLGERWTYSGQAFLYLQEALVSIWNEPASVYLKRLVLDPLNMRQSSFLWREEYEETAVDGFDQKGNIPGPCIWKPTEVDGASSLHTNATEYARLLEAFLEPGLISRHPDVFQQQVKIDSRLGWSLGWGTAGDALWQWGYHIAFNAFAAIVPSRGIGIVCLTNGARGQRIIREWVNAWLETNLSAFYFRSVEL
jgi:CubicO group peptidase (beta-lactamase class C family)